VKPLEKIKPLLVYTMTSGLGDFIVLGDLVGKIEVLIPGARCLIVHRDNPHVRLWPGTDVNDRFFSIFSVGELSRFAHSLSAYRKAGYTVFGLQMAPGSIQGFIFYRFLKRFGLVDYIVDFNLINADVITPPKGEYILDLHLNQVGELLQIEIPPALYELRLPVAASHPVKASGDKVRTIGIHPWSRRGHIRSFVWSFEKWEQLIRHLLREYENCNVVVFGRDKSFDEFKRFISDNVDNTDERISFSYSNSVGELVNTIENLDYLITVNTAVVHIGYALRKQMTILNGPSLDLWVPKGRNIYVIRDKQALFQASDKWEEDGNFGSIDRIEVSDVVEVLSARLAGG
jgi:hypothetical protein